MMAGGASSFINCLVRQFENLNRYPGNLLRCKFFMQPENDSLGQTGSLEGTRKPRAFSKFFRDV